MLGEAEKNIEGATVSKGVTIEVGEIVLTMADPLAVLSVSCAEIDTTKDLTFGNAGLPSINFMFGGADEAAVANFAKSWAFQGGVSSGTINVTVLDEMTPDRLLDGYATAVVTQVEGSISLEYTCPQVGEVMMLLEPADSASDTYKFQMHVREALEYWREWKKFNWDAMDFIGEKPDPPKDGFGHDLFYHFPRDGSLPDWQQRYIFDLENLPEVGFNVATNTDYSLQVYCISTCNHLYTLQEGPKLFTS